MEASAVVQRAIETKVEAEIQGRLKSLLSFGYLTSQALEILQPKQPSQISVNRGGRSRGCGSRANR